MPAKIAMKKGLKVLVVDIGGSHVKCLVSGRKRSRKFKSGPAMTPGIMMRSLARITGKWRFDVVSIGYPGVVRHGRIAREPHNLGPGWIGFDFERAFACPVKIINDAAMQALGGYQSGKMLFLGLGTGLGSALIVDGVIADLELGHLQCSDESTYEDLVGEQGRKRVGNKQWRGVVSRVVEALRDALLPDEIVLGGGNTAHLKKLPPETRIGASANAFEGGFRLWQRVSGNDKERG